MPHQNCQYPFCTRCEEGPTRCSEVMRGAGSVRRGKCLVTFWLKGSSSMCSLSTCLQTTVEFEFRISPKSGFDLVSHHTYNARTKPQTCGSGLFCIQKNFSSAKSKARLPTLNRFWQYLRAPVVDSKKDSRQVASDVATSRAGRLKFTAWRERRERLSVLNTWRVDELVSQRTLLTFLPSDNCHFRREWLCGGTRQVCAQEHVL